MHFSNALVIAIASALPHVVSQTGDQPSGVGCGIDGFTDAYVPDCRAAIAQIDTSLNVATNPGRCLDVVVPSPFRQWCIVAQSGDCQIGAATTIPGGGVPVGTSFSGQKTVNYANAIVNGCNNGAGLVNGQAFDGQQGIGVSARF